MAKRDSITADQVRAALHYDPETGVLRWRWRDDVPKRWNTRYAGKVAGGVWRSVRSGKVYWRIILNGRFYFAHRLAWFHHHGEWPSDQIDHENLDGLDNRMVNLRDATHGDNQSNKSVRKDSLTGMKGVSFFKARGKYHARIFHNGRTHHLGYFDAIEDAGAAYAAAATRLKGEFARPDPRYG